MFGEVSSDGAPINRVSRLWTYTEWLKAEVAYTTGPEKTNRIQQAYAAIERFQIDASSGPGLWAEEWNGATGQFSTGSTKATSLYHLTLAIEVLLEYCGLHPNPFAQKHRASV